MCGFISHDPHWRPGPQPKHVPWLGIELATLWFAGPCSILLSYNQPRLGEVYDYTFDLLIISILVRIAISSWFYLSKWYVFRNFPISFTLSHLMACNYSNSLLWYFVFLWYQISLFSHTKFIYLGPLFPSCSVLLKFYQFAYHFKEPILGFVHLCWYFPILYFI